MKICPACESRNRIGEKYCLNCGQKLIEKEEDKEITKETQKLNEEEEDKKTSEEKLEIPKDKIILLDLNYTLISNSWKIRHDRLPQKIFNREYEDELVEKIKDNHVILITASPYCTSFDSLRHIEENTDLKISESYWNFGKRPPELKEYWLKKAVLPSHGYEAERYLAIESNKDTRAMYARFGIEARPKSDFI